MFYAWHYYGNPRTPELAVENALALQQEWNVPSFNTEFGGCDAWNACEAAGISHTYWHYSRSIKDHKSSILHQIPNPLHSYCTTGPSFGNLSVPDETFGGCLLGWAGGDSSKTC